jgi:hypothetical protein
MRRDEDTKVWILIYGRSCAKTARRQNEKLEYTVQCCVCGIASRVGQSSQSTLLLFVLLQGIWIGNDFKGSGNGLNPSSYYAAICLPGREISVRLSIVRAKVKSQYLPDSKFPTDMPRTSCSATLSTLVDFYPRFGGMFSFPNKFLLEYRDVTSESTSCSDNVDPNRLFAFCRVYAVSWTAAGILGATD